MAGDPSTAAAVHREQTHTHKVTLEMGAVVVSAGCRQSPENTNNTNTVITTAQCDEQRERGVTAGCSFISIFKSGQREKIFGLCLLMHHGMHHGTSDMQSTNPEEGEEQPKVPPILETGHECFFDTDHKKWHNRIYLWQLMLFR